MALEVLKTKRFLSKALQGSLLRRRIFLRLINHIQANRWRCFYLAVLFLSQCRRQIYAISLHHLLPKMAFKMPVFQTQNRAGVHRSGNVRVVSQVCSQEPTAFTICALDISLAAHSQTIRVRHPRSFKTERLRLSRSTFILNFSRQNFAFVAGVLASRQPS